VKKFLKGMHKDAERVDMPEGTYRDALNANANYLKGAITNEHGTVQVGNVIISPVGQVALDDNNFCVFGIDLNANTSGIVLCNPTENTTTLLYVSDDLNFSLQHPIEATFKRNSKKDIFVYFTDNKYEEVETDAYTYVTDNNPPRVFNISRQLRALADNAANVFSLYGENLTIDILDLFPNPGTLARIDGVEIVDGGGLNTAAYHLALSYVDEDLNRTNYFVVSNPVSIVSANEYSFPIESMIGDARGSQTKKSIIWKVRVYEDCNYKFIQPAIVRVEGGASGIEAREAFRLAPIELSKQNEIIDIVFTGIETYTTMSVEEIVTSNPRYLAAKTLTQSDKRLLLSNLKLRPDIGYQKFANAIQVEAVAEEIENFDPRVFSTYTLNYGYYTMLNPNLNDGEALQTGGAGGGFNFDYVSEVIKPLQENSTRGYRNANRIFRKKSFRRNEVYALYISFILKDGTETAAYHIPGRAPVGIYSQDNNPIISERNLVSDFQNPGAYFQMSTEEITSTIPDAKAYQMFDSTILDLGPNSGLTTSFWENEHEFYPDTNDFDIWSVDVNGNAVNTNETLRGQRVRHHKLPSNANSNFSYIQRSVDFSSPTIYQESDDSGTVQFNETIRLLGVRFTNIRIPRDILNQVQEYRIYYAKRKDEDKTIVGSGVPVPGHPRYAMQLTTGRTTATSLKNHTAFYMKGEPASAQIAGSTMSIRNPLWAEGIESFYGSPVFKVHDFTMLRDEKNISNITHIDVQFILTCRHFRGGPHVYNDDNVQDNEGYDPMGWIHPDLNNTTDPNDDDVAVRAWQTSLMLATAYWRPNASNIDCGVSLGSSEHIYATNLLRSGNNIFMIDDASKAYLPGLRNLKDERSASFRGSNYLLNFIGETGIALGLKSGLPSLSGFHPGMTGDGQSLFTDGLDPDDYSGVALGWHSKNRGYLNIYNDFEENNWVDSRNFALNNNQSYAHGMPNVYLINLCSRKSNVYNPFDRQELVWTGHSQKIINPNLNSGEVSPDLIGYEIEETQLSSNFNYYNGASSTRVFGGDTFITRYSVRTTSMEYGWTFHRNPTSGAPISIPFNLDPNSSNYGETAGILIFESNAIDSVDAFSNIDNKSNQNHTPVSTLMSYICESDDNINFRHAYDAEKGVDPEDAKFFDYYHASSVIFQSPLSDLTARDNILYESHYSAVQDLKVPQPFQKLTDTFIYAFPTRVVRSAASNNQIFDGYKLYAPLDFIDIPEEAGEVWKITQINNLVYIQSKQSLYVTKGKENLELAGASVFVGSGDIFQQDPDKILDTDLPIGGTTSQFAAIRCPEGYFFVSTREKRVYLLGESMEPISAYGMEYWFLNNIPFVLEQYGLNPYSTYSNVNLDAPTQYFGFVSSYDPNYKRILLTKNEVIPTTLFLDLYNDNEITFNNVTGEFNIINNNTIELLAGSPTYDNTNYFTPSGWTLAYLPAIKAWISKYSFIPKLYTFTNDNFYTYFNDRIWEHSDSSNPCNFYNQLYNFEFEYIDNTSPVNAKIYSSVYFMADVTTDNSNDINPKFIDTTFNSYYVYNTHQISGQPTPINYLNNTRKIDKIWYINEFRDLTRFIENTNFNLTTNLPNVQENFTQFVSTPNELRMFTAEGQVNPNYINESKPWYEQKRFVDNYLGVRLIATNESRRLINLYSAGTKFRQAFR
jgi:hypothetical protein